MDMTEATMSVVSVLLFVSMAALHLRLRVFLLSDSPNAQILPSSDLPREGERFNLQCLGNSNPE